MILFLALVLGALVGSSSSNEFNVDLPDDQEPQCEQEQVKAARCPLRGDEKNLCDGQVYIVEDQRSCERLMSRRGCGVAFTWAVTDGARASHGGRHLYCRLVLKRDGIAVVEPVLHVKHNVTDILYFKMRAGAGPEPYDALVQQPLSGEILFPRSNAQSFSTGGYYKSPLYAARNALGATAITVGMFGNTGSGSDSCLFTFGNSQGDNGEWFNKANLQYSYPVKAEVLKGIDTHFFSAIGYSEKPRYQFNRQFYIMRHDNCPGDHGGSVVFAGQDTCPYGDPGNPSYPKFLCMAAWSPESGLQPREPNINSKGRFMREFEIFGKLPQPVDVLYLGQKDN